VADAGLGRKCDVSYLSHVAGCDALWMIDAHSVSRDVGSGKR
jgi:hypothetical protein